MPIRGCTGRSQHWLPQTACCQWVNWFCFWQFILVFAEFLYTSADSVLLCSWNCKRSGVQFWAGPVQINKVPASPIHRWPLRVLQSPARGLRRVLRLKMNIWPQVLATSLQTRETEASREGRKSKKQYFHWEVELRPSDFHSLPLTTPE